MIVKRRFSFFILTSILLLFAAWCQNSNSWLFGAKESGTVRYQHAGSGHIERALASDDNLVLFFGSVRCPSCRALDQDIAMHVSQIPDDLRIITFDFDNDVVWKTKYKILSTHTLVYLDSSDVEVARSVKREKTLAAIVNRLSQITNTTVSSQTSSWSWW